MSFRARILLSTPGPIVQLSNRGFAPILFLEFLAREKQPLPFMVVTGDDWFNIEFQSYNNHAEKKAAEIVAYINANQ